MCKVKQTDSMFNKRLARVGLALACLAGVCTASATDIAAGSAADLVSGNTLSVTNRFGPSYIYFEPSGRIQVTGGSVVARGSWRADKDRICTTTDPTPEGRVTPEFCMDLGGKTRDSSWTGSDPKNGKLTFRMLTGNQSLTK